MDNFKDSRKIVGIKQSLKAVEEDLVKKLYVASDADEKVVKNIKDLCLAKNIEIVMSENMKQLGKACGIDVGASVVCLLKV